MDRHCVLVAVTLVLGVACVEGPGEKGDAAGGGFTIVEAVGSQASGSTGGPMGAEIGAWEHQLTKKYLVVCPTGFSLQREMTASINIYTAVTLQTIGQR